LKLPVRVETPIVAKILLEASEFSFKLHGGCVFCPGLYIIDGWKFFHGEVLRRAYDLNVKMGYWKDCGRLRLSGRNLRVFHVLTVCPHAA